MMLALRQAALPISDRKGSGLGGGWKPWCSTTPEST
jgi:hypothetical protein